MQPGPRNSITDVPGILVGHAQNAAAAKGCTVILCESGTAAGVDVRGGSPGTRETDCLAPTASLPCPQAFYLSGGSAFGLDGATGVHTYLEAKGIGFDTGVARVPIVSGAVIFDLNVGAANVRPDAAMGLEACRNAGVDVAQGNIGVGIGATAGWAAGPSRRMKVGLGTASCRTGGLIVGAIVAVNCYGDVVDPATGEVLAGTLNEAGDGFAGSQRLLTATPMGTNPLTSHSTIGVVASNARLDKAQASRVAMMAHDGFARAIVPVHTYGEGDVIFSAMTGVVEAGVSVVGVMAAEAMAQAILNAVKCAESAYGYPGYREVLERRKKAREKGASGAER
ncbi:MAG: P1 family peptidase [Spirochaetes bacterium]|nr:P1 family peptidase [Spirochaetota bacterium]